MLALSPIVMAQDPLRGWTVVPDKTTALNLVAVHESKEFVSFHLQNVSSKAITAFAFSLFPESDDLTDYRDCSDNGPNCLVPGAVFEVRLGLPLNNEGRIFRILAVRFEDGASEGVKSHADYLRWRRLALALEGERMNGILAGQGENALDDHGLASLVEKIGPLPETPEGALSSLEKVSLPGISIHLEFVNADKRAKFAFLSGIRSARHEALRNMAQVKALPEMLSGIYNTRSSSATGSGTRTLPAPTRADVFKVIREQYATRSEKTRLFYEHLQREGARQ